MEYLPDEIQKKIYNYVDNNQILSYWFAIWRESVIYSYKGKWYIIWD